MQRLNTTILLLCSTVVVCLGQYGTNNVLYEVGQDLAFISVVLTADLDMDGDNDVIATGKGNHTIAWFENDGTGDFGMKQVITNQFNSVTDIAIADFDGDGIPDLAATSGGENRVLWFRNDGSGTFTIGDTVTNTAMGATSVSTGDLDNDGDIDIVSSSQTDNKVSWYANDGAGNFSEETILSIAVNNAQKVQAADMNEDGLIDIIASAPHLNSILAFVNLGGGSFTGAVVITDESFFVKDFFIADMDNDGDSDILTRSANFSTLHYGLYYYRFNGTVFESSPVVINSEYDPFGGFTVADMDGDEDMDIVLFDNRHSQLHLYTNDGEGSFPPPEAIGLPGSSYPGLLHAGDIDGDDKADLLFEYSNDISWMGNDHIQGMSVEDTLHLITSNDSISIKDKLVIKDIDGDRDLDILVRQWKEQSFTSEYSVIQGDGNGGFQIPSVIVEHTSEFPRRWEDDFFFSCIDADTLPDIIQEIGSNTIIWFRNLGGGIFQQDPVIYQINGFTNLEIQEVIDIDGDGDNDLLCVIKNDTGKFSAIQFNDGTGSFDISILDGPAFEPSSNVKILTGDMDNDGDLDIMGGFLNGNIFLLRYENMGNGTFHPGISQLVPHSFFGIKNFLPAAADLEGDGDDELFMTYAFYNPTGFHGAPEYFHHYYIYDLGDPGLESIVEYSIWPHGFTSGSFNSSPYTEFEVVYEDYNRDGNIDLLTVKSDLSGIHWLLGDGLGLFPTSIQVDDVRIFNSGDGFPDGIGTALMTADVEQDGDRDVFVFDKSSLSSGSRIDWYRNISVLPDVDDDGFDLLADCDDNNPDIGDQLPVPDLGPDTELCEGEALQFSNLNIVEGATYQWAGPDGFASPDSDPLIDPVGLENSGTYSLVIYLNDCVSPEGTTDVTIFELPSVYLEQDGLELTASGDDIFSYQWFDVAGVIHGATESVFTVENTGDYFVEVVDLNGCYAFSDTVSVVATALPDHSLASRISVYPNPVSASENLIVKMPYDQNVQYVIYDITGHPVESDILSQATSAIELSSFKSGVYLLEFTNGSNRHTFKIIVIN
ncbi:MAG: T9SS type A sorting domain-containing protein [Bacteroidetes bacterium]|nr:T9SS type A sorting domain-containing protein [Bacteroidota bacterium]